MAKVSPIPACYQNLIPYLVLGGKAAEAIDFYKKAFGAEETVRMGGPDGKVGHAELKIGDCILMLSDGGDGFPNTKTSLCIYVTDCDAVFARAVEAGATVKQPLEDKFYGDRAATVEDPFGQRWSIMTHIEDVTPEQMEERMKNLKM